MKNDEQNHGYENWGQRNSMLSQSVDKYKLDKKYCGQVDSDYNPYHYQFKLQLSVFADWCHQKGFILYLLYVLTI